MLKGLSQFDAVYSVKEKKVEEREFAYLCMRMPPDANLKLGKLTIYTQIFPTEWDAVTAHSDSFVRKIKLPEDISILWTAAKVGESLYSFGLIKDFGKGNFKPCYVPFS